MKGPVGLSAVLIGTDAGGHHLPLGQDVGALFVGGTFAGQGGGLGLKDSPQLKQIPQTALHAIQTVKAEVFNFLYLGGDKGALAPAHLQHPLGAQRADGLPQGGPAHPQLLGQLHLVGQLVPGLEALLRHDLVIECGSSLLPAVFSFHRVLLDVKSSLTFLSLSYTI